MIDMNLTTAVITVLAFLGIPTIWHLAKYVRRGIGSIPRVVGWCQKSWHHLIWIIYGRRQLSAARLLLKQAKSEMLSNERTVKNAERVLRRASVRPRELLLEVPTSDLIRGLAHIDTEGAVRGLIAIARGGVGEDSDQQLLAIRALAGSRQMAAREFLFQITSPSTYRIEIPGGRVVPPFDLYEEREVFDRIPGHLGKKPDAIDLVRKAIKDGRPILANSTYAIAS